MKKRAVWVLIILFVSLAIPTYAQYSSTAYGGADNETMLNKISDWFATVGKPEEEKYRIKAQRRGERKIKKAKKDIARKKKALAKKREALAR
jgi:hypothetical protein